MEINFVIVRMNLLIPSKCVLLWAATDNIVAWVTPWSTFNKRWSWWPALPFIPSKLFVSLIDIKVAWDCANPIHCWQSGALGAWWSIEWTCRAESPTRRGGLLCHRHLCFCWYSVEEYLLWLAGQARATMYRKASKSFVGQEPVMHNDCHSFPSSTAIRCSVILW